jgi:hypothetical protein
MERDWFEEEEGYSDQFVLEASISATTQRYFDDECEELMDTGSTPPVMGNAVNANPEQLAGASPSCETPSRNPPNIQNRTPHNDTQESNKCHCECAKFSEDISSS